MLTGTALNSSKPSHPVPYRPQEKSQLADWLLLGMVAFLGWQIVKVADSRGFQNDFAHYYVSSKAYLTGQGDVYRVDLGDQYDRLSWKELDEPVFRASNPPGLLILFSLFALLPPNIAFWLWIVVQLACLVAIYCLSKRLLRDRLSDQQFKFVVAAFLALPIVEAHFYYSQVQLLLVVLVLMAFDQSRRGNHISACTWICVAALLKVFPVVLLPWFVWNSGRNQSPDSNGNKLLSIRSRAVICSVSFLGAGFMLLGPQLWLDFFSYASPGISVWAKSFPSYTISSFFAKIGIVVTGSNSTQLTNILFFVGLGFSLTLVGWLYSRIFREQRDAILEFATLNMMMLLCGTTCWLHYLVFIFFPFAVCASHLIAAPGPFKWISAAVVYLMLHTCLFSLQTVGASKLFFTNLPFFSMCIIFSYLVCVLNRSCDLNRSCVHNRFGVDHRSAPPALASEQNASQPGVPCTQ